MAGLVWRRLPMVRRGEIYYANLSPVVGSEQGGRRPVLIVQNDVGNRYSPTVVVAAITAQISKGKLPTHVELPAADCQLERDSVVLLEQLRTLDKHRLGEKVTVLQFKYMARIDRAIGISIGLVRV